MLGFQSLSFDCGRLCVVRSACPFLDRLLGDLAAGRLGGLVGIAKDMLCDLRRRLWSSWRFSIVRFAAVVVYGMVSV